MIFFVATILLFNLLFFWANANIDSYFFWAFGQYLATGNYPFLPDFTYARPTTMAPPMMSAIMAITQFTPVAALLIRIVQTILLSSTAYILFLLLKRSFSKKASTVIACLFILIPGNLVYVNYLMSEILAQFFITLVLYLLLTKKYSLAFFWAAVGMLSKYAVILYAPIALLFPARKRFSFILAGIFVTAGWISINYSITGSIGLSDLRGGHLYNNVVWVAGITPSEDSIAMKKLRSFVPQNVDIRKAYWDLQTFILPKVGNNFAVFDGILGTVATLAIKEHPIRYGGSVIQNFIALHGNTLPYWENLGHFGKPQGAYPLNCDPLGNIALCKPPIPTSWSIPVWNAVIGLSNGFYRYLWPIIMVIFFVSLLRGNILSLLYVSVVLLHAALEHHDTRYLIPFYPQIVLVIALGIKGILFHI